LDLASIVERFLDRPRVTYLRAVLDAYGDAPGALLAGGLAFAAIFAIVPITVLTVGIAGWIAGDIEIQGAIVAALAGAFPPLATLIDQALDAVVSGAAAASILGFLGTIWTVSQFYAALDTAFARVFGEAPGRLAVRRTLRSFVWVGLLIGIVVTYIVGASLSATLAMVIPDSIPASRFLAALLGSPATIFAVLATLLLLLYRTVPPYTPRWRAVWLPSGVVAVVILLLSFAIASFAPLLVGVASIVGPLAVMFVALAWLSFTFQAILIGAAWVRVGHERATEIERVPLPPAEPD
jgi:membrane protein